MIKEIAKTSPNKYGRYFLSTEAPGDEEIDSPIKFNTKVIEVKPNNRRRLDFTDGAEEIDEEVPEEPSEEDLDNQDLDYDDENQDFTQDDNLPDPPEQITDGSSQPTVTEPTGDGTEQSGDPNVTGEEPLADPPAIDPNVAGDATNQTDDPNVTGEEPLADPPAIDPNVAGDGAEINTDTQGDMNGPALDDTNEDFTSGADDPEAADASVAPPPEEQKRGPGLEYDSTRKYNLFENYMSLANAIQNYITKLENNMGESHEENLIIKTSTEKLREIYQLCYDYMTMKFEISTYVQSLLFFQNLVIMVQLVFDLLSKTRKKIKK